MADWRARGMVLVAVVAGTAAACGSRTGDYLGPGLGDGPGAGGLSGVGAEGGGGVMGQSAAGLQGSAVGGITNGSALGSVMGASSFGMGPGCVPGQCQCFDCVSECTCSTGDRLFCEEACRANQAVSGTGFGVGTTFGSFGVGTTFGSFGAGTTSGSFGVGTTFGSFGVGPAVSVVTGSSWSSSTATTTGAGGAPATSTGDGGAGGVAECIAQAQTRCETCLCSDCFQAYGDCIGDFGCPVIFECMDRTGCTGLDCYTPDTCQPVIDQFGGLAGASVSYVIELIECAVGASCPCQ